MYEILNRYVIWDEGEKFFGTTGNVGLRTRCAGYRVGEGRDELFSLSFSRFLSREFAGRDSLSWYCCWCRGSLGGKSRDVLVLAAAAGEGRARHGRSLNLYYSTVLYIFYIENERQYDRCFAFSPDSVSRARRRRKSRFHRPGLLAEIFQGKIFV